MSELKKLLIVIPTYNSKQNVQKKLDLEIEIYRDKGVELYIADSSTNDEVKLLIHQYNAKGYKNIAYYKYPETLTSNEKVICILESLSDREQEYEYIWMIHDHTTASLEGIEDILNALDEGDDFYLLNMQSNSYKIQKYDDIQRFLYVGAWRSNSFGTTIIRIDSFLNGVDWKFIKRRYLTKKTINYAHVGMYYERIADMISPKMVEVSLNRKDFMDFNRNKIIAWNTEVIRICLESWTEVINRLPRCYQNKKDVRKTQDEWFLSKYSLIEYKSDGYYCIKHFFKYFKYIIFGYPRRVMEFFMIATLPAQVSIKVFCGELIRKVKNNKKNNGCVYIFGAGRHAFECASFLEKMEIDFDGFIVTNVEGNPRMLAGKNVYEAQKELNNKRSLVIMGILSSGILEAIEYLDNLKDEKTLIECFEMK